jgi:hypothetical protein
LALNSKKEVGKMVWGELKTSFLKRDEVFNFLLAWQLERR